MLQPQMRFLRCTHSKPAARNGGRRALPENRTLLVHFLLLCFSLAFFLKGVLVGVGDGVPENSGVGDGRTRG